MTWSGDIFGLPRIDNSDEARQPYVYLWQQALSRARLCPELMATAFIMSTFGNGDGTRIFVGAERIALGLGKAPATVRRYRTRLVDLGWFHIEQRGGTRGGPRLHQYRLTIPENAQSKEDIDGLLTELIAGRIEWRALPQPIGPPSRPRAPTSTGSTPRPDGHRVANPDPAPKSTRPRAPTPPTPRPQGLTTSTTSLTKLNNANPSQKQQTKTTHTTDRIGPTLSLSLAL